MIHDTMNVDLAKLADVAWQFRSKALIRGTNAVGAAVLADDGTIFGGCNLQHRYRSQDVHAEVASIVQMVAAGRQRPIAIIVVSEVTDLAPCGGCLDWIIQLGGDDCIVAWQCHRSGSIESKRA